MCGLNHLHSLNIGESPSLYVQDNCNAARVKGLHILHSFMTPALLLCAFAPISVSLYLNPFLSQFIEI